LFAALAGLPASILHAAAFLRLLPVGSLEVVLPVALGAIVNALGELQVNMGIHATIAGSGMVNRKGEGVLIAAYLSGKLAGKFDLLLQRQFFGQGNLQLPDRGCPEFCVNG